MIFRVIINVRTFLVVSAVAIVLSVVSGWPIIGAFLGLVVVLRLAMEARWREEDSDQQNPPDRHE